MTKILVSICVMLFVMLFAVVCYAPPVYPQGAGWPPAMVVVITNAPVEAPPAPELTEEEWQAAKTPMLKSVENLYVNFLTNDWTMCLRSNSFISADSTVTVENTTEQQNIIYLMTLRAIDKRSYYDLAGEFDRFKSVIVENGGIMAKVKVHQIP